MIKQELDGLLQKKMDRLTFIKHVGIGFGAIVGVTGVLKSMTSLGETSPAGTSKLAAQSYGYGASTYGGGRSSQRVLN